jgi:3-dehydroquinate synthase
METIRVELGDRSYDIAIGTGILDGLAERLKSFALSPRVAVVSNPTVFSIYGERILAPLKKAGFEVLTVMIPDGEEYKNLDTLKRIYDDLLKYKLDRKSAVIALGGGVVGDMTGFAASTYMRGIAYVQAPTTLLAQVDSSVGGKTGIDHELGKNMIGAFWQPALVWIDPETLKTLPPGQLMAGFAEVIKYGVIYDKGLFDFLEVNREKILNLDNEALTHIIRRSCEIKAEIVSKDERESGLRAILNYGHTIGHAIETATGYTRFLHGEAVSIGMHLEAKLSQALNLIKREEVLKIKAIIDAYGLPSALPAGIDVDYMLSSMQLDKKSVAGELKFILPQKIGVVIIHKGIDAEFIRQVLYSEG